MSIATVRGPLTRSDLLSLPAAVDVETAARAFGIGRTTAYTLAKTGQFPCKVLRAGKAYRVITEDMLRVLQITSESSDGVGVASPTPSVENAPATTSAN
ncbi:helix-turn-helix domain-containing protein [Streptomyces scabiei]|uniref:helix-turn-helix domain-containing protein n=1 Tax=Streptomyces scabiei TaxID=1930 RepID=UPI0007C69CD0|nr:MULTISPECIES: helix-turn-helix domain-containing protein [Streptomyces]MBP5862816.1 helix-turn-helix domain-containing protein [Streptomyces sp. LBUM 1484]MBP5876719.1 helix-turn-helix domain-containing protein [Streptomyces sp. LBUM 1477]MBP5884507.1 helix-turn-helix domain-containing protein [Streptomyces sp. LBUM 1487]